MDTTPVEIKLDGRTAYFSGPMREYPEANKPTFELAEAMFASHAFQAGYLSAPDAPVTVVHPHQEGVYTNGQTLAAAMQLADFMVQLPGSARPGGTMEDLVLFIHMRKPVFTYDPVTGALIRYSAPYIGFAPPKPDAMTDGLEGLLDGEAADPFDPDLSVDPDDLEDPDEV